MAASAAWTLRRTFKDSEARAAMIGFARVSALLAKDIHNAVSLRGRAEKLETVSVFYGTKQAGCLMKISYAINNANGRYEVVRTARRLSKGSWKKCGRHIEKIGAARAVCFSYLIHPADKSIVLRNSVRAKKNTAAAVRFEAAGGDSSLIHIVIAPQGRRLCARPG